MLMASLYTSDQCIYDALFPNCLSQGSPIRLAIQQHQNLPALPQVLRCNFWQEHVEWLEDVRANLNDWIKFVGLRQCALKSCPGFFYMARLKTLPNDGPVNGRIE